MKTITKKECVLILLHERERLERIFETCPVLAPMVKYYDYKIAELLCDADKIGILAKSLYEEYSHDRKAVAGVLGKHRLSAVGFRCIDTGLSGREVLLAMPVERFCKWIPDYVHEDDISALFSPVYELGALKKTAIPSSIIRPSSDIISPRISCPAR